MRMITGAQVRAARAFLDWTIADLASAAGVSDSTIRAIEKVDSDPTVSSEGIAPTLGYRAGARAESVEKIVAAFNDAGISFTRETDKAQGIRWTKNSVIKRN